jgi:precorrin-6B methylase 2
MNIWFDSAQALFEVFLEEKLACYGSAVTAVGDCAPQELTMRTLPTEFLDCVHRRMEGVYYDLPSGYEASNVGDGSEFLYGELTPVGVRQLGTMIASYAPATHAGGLFIDFGCGTGKVVFELALLTPRMRCIGVELSVERAMIAKIAAEQIAHDAPNLEIVSGSFFDYPAEDAPVTAAFCCGLGFDDVMTMRLLDRLALFAQIEMCVLLLRQDAKIFRTHPLFVKAVSVDFAVTLNTSWMNEAPATVLRFK